MDQSLRHIIDLARLYGAAPEMLAVLKEVSKLLNGSVQRAADKLDKNESDNQKAIAVAKLYQLTARVALVVKQAEPRMERRME